jgi:hypothetical protein
MREDIDCGLVEHKCGHLSEQKMWPTMKDNVAIPSASIVGKYFLVVRPLSNMHKAGL